MPHRTPPLSDEDLLAFHHGTLPEEQQAALADRIAADPAAQALLSDWAQQDEALRTLFPLPEPPVPERLTAALRRPRATPAPRPRRALPRTLVAALALLAIGGLGGWIGRGALAPMPADLPLAQAALKAYNTYVVEVIHPVEVPASQRDHLETWMSKRVGARLIPPDLSASGFALMGGRVLPSEDGTAGLFMYENAQGQRLTLYVAPQKTRTNSAFRYAEEGPTQGLYWQEGSLGYAVVGQISRDSLRQIAREAYDQML